MVSSLVKQGPNIVLRNLLQAINTDLFEVHVLTFKQEKDNSLIEEITRNEKIKLHFCQYERLGSVSSINSIIEMINPDIVHSHGFSADFINAISIQKNQRKITTIHSYIYRDYYFEHGLKGIIAALIHNIILFKFDVVCACSDSVMRYLKKIFIKSLSVRNGVPDYKKNINMENQHVMERIKSEHKFIFTFVGRLMARKNLFYMLDSFICSKRLDDSIFLIIGDGPDEKELKLKYGHIPQVRFLGFLENTLYYMSYSDYLVLVSKAEGLPMVVLEGLSVGIPVILSNINPHREVFEVSQAQIGYILNENNNNLKDIFDNILKPNGEYKKICLDSFANYFSSSLMAKKYEEVYSGAKK